MVDNRSRIIRINNNIVITNLKCMYSSINKLNINELNPIDKPEYNRIFLFRESNIRIISCFLCWCIKNPRELLAKNGINNIELNGILTKIKKHMSNNQFDFFMKKCLENDISDNNLIELFKIFLSKLPLFYLSDLHTVPQYYILLQSGMQPDMFVNCDKKQDVETLSKILGQDIPITNPSDSQHKIILNSFLKENKEAAEIINALYKIDTFIS